MDDERVPKGRLPSTPGSTPTRVVYLLGGALEPSEDGQVVGGVERQIARVVWGMCDRRREGTKAVKETHVAVILTKTVQRRTCNAQNERELLGIGTRGAVERNELE